MTEGVVNVRRAKPRLTGPALNEAARTAMHNYEACGLIRPGDMLARRIIRRLREQEQN